MTFLDVQSLGVRYGGIRAVKDIDIQVNEGETVALIGANGAGKTSMLNAIAGLLDHTGDVDFNDMKLAKRPVFERVQCGISLVPEGRGVFGRLTVEENLLMGAYLVLQILDGYLLVPLLFSDAVKLHPVIIMLAVFVFGAIFGFWGVFFAIPIATLIKAIWNSWPENLST